MPQSYGRAVAPAVTGYPLEVSADGDPEWKVGGVTLDWSTIAAVSADVTLPDGIVVKNGQKYLRFGQVLTLIGVAEVQTAATQATPVTGTVIFTLPAVGDAPAQSGATLSWTSTTLPTAQAVADNLNALSRIGPNGVTVTLSAQTYTITFARRLGDVPQLTSVATGSGNTFTHATTTAGQPTYVSGNYQAAKYGPYDPSATDGRQTLSRGECYILNQTVVETGLLSPIFPPVADHPAVLEGGLVWRERLLATAMAAGTLALGPTFTNLLTAFPRLRFVNMT
jgi:predicted RecA/RadA family phage recombinase